MPNEPLLATAADLWHTWNQRRIKAAGDDDYFQEDYDLIAAVTAIYHKQVERLVAQHVKDQLEVDAASNRLADEIAELLGTK